MFDGKTEMYDILRSKQHEGLHGRKLLLLEDLTKDFKERQNIIRWVSQNTYILIINNRFHRMKIEAHLEAVIPY